VEAGREHVLGGQGVVGRDRVLAAAREVAPGLVDDGLTVSPLVARPVALGWGSAARPLELGRAAIASDVPGELGARPVAEAGAGLEEPTHQGVTIRPIGR
jgi:hypothetical protein